jgi:transposase
MPIASSLPNEIETLKRLVQSRDDLIAQLMAEIARLKRWKFGRSSERVAELTTQLQLALGELRTNDSQPEDSKSAQASNEGGVTDSDLKGQSKGNRKVVPLRRPPRAFPAHLPRETIMHAPKICDCPECGAQMRKLGEDVSEMLDYVPGYFKVIRHVRPKLACGVCATIIQEPAATRPIARAMVSAGLLTQIVISKFADHVPLYRQEGIYLRSSVELDRATMASWVQEAAKLITPLVNALSRHVLGGGKIHTDDTPIPVLAPGRGKTKTGRMWTYVRDDRPAGSRAPPAVWYQYSPDRKGERPREHLRDYRGILQADAYTGYGKLYENGEIVEAACMAHARRKFHDVYARQTSSPIAAEAIRRIGLLYAIEETIRGKKAAERMVVRQRESVPIMAELKSWMESTYLMLSAKSELAGAIRYALVRWAALSRYCTDGRIEIDNNTAEREIRPLVLGRKNFLFYGSDRGGESAAAVYSLIGTARLNGVEPFAYLKAVFERIAEHPINRIEELLPWNIEIEETEQRMAA